MVSGKSTLAANSWGPVGGVCFGKTNRGSLESFEPGSVPWALFSSLPNHSLAVLGGVMRWIILQGGQHCHVYSPTGS